MPTTRQRARRSSATQNDTTISNPDSSSPTEPTTTKPTTHSSQPDPRTDTALNATIASLLHLPPTSTPLTDLLSLTLAKRYISFHTSPNAKSLALTDPTSQFTTYISATKLSHHHKKRILALFDSEYCRILFANGADGGAAQPKLINSNEKLLRNVGLMVGMAKPYVPELEGDDGVEGKLDGALEAFWSELSRHDDVAMDEDGDADNDNDGAATPVAATSSPLPKTAEGEEEEGITTTPLANLLYPASQPITPENARLVIFGMMAQLRARAAGWQVNRRCWDARQGRMVDLSLGGEGGMKEELEKCVRGGGEIREKIERVLWLFALENNWLFGE